MKTPTFKQWDHLEKEDKARRVRIVEGKLLQELNFNNDPNQPFIRSNYEGLSAHAIYCVAARLDGDLKEAQEYLDGAIPFSQANTRYSTWVKFKRLTKPYDAILALAHKPNLIADTTQLLANDIGIGEELPIW